MKFSRKPPSWLTSAEFLAELKDIYNIIARNNERLDGIQSDNTMLHTQTLARLNEMVALAKDAVGVPDPDHTYAMDVWMEQEGIPRVWQYNIGRVGQSWVGRYEWPMSSVNYWDLDVNLRRQTITFSLPGQGPLTFPLGPFGQWNEYHPANILVKARIW